MAVLTALSDDNVRQLLQHYDVGELALCVGIPEGSVNSNFSVETDRGRYFLRLYEEQGTQGAERETAMLSMLAEQGIPTPMPVRTRAGTCVVMTRNKPAVLFPYRSGTMRCQSSVRARDLEMLGRELGRLHLVGGEGPEWESRFRLRDLDERLTRIERQGDTAHREVAPGLRARVRELEPVESAPLPVGLIHGDLFRDNVLWDGEGSIAAMLDFESASRGTFLYDIMVAALAWCFDNELEHQLLRAFFRGYQSSRPLSLSECSLARDFARLAALRFTVTRITDYAMRALAGPRVVKDWRRFHARLLAVEALSTTEWERIVQARGG